jgi:hypothetical protein
MPRSLTWDEVCARRLDRHHLLARAPADRLVEVVGDICGIHAQVITAGELSLAIRVDGIARAMVRAALWDERRLIKTWGIRGTVHLYPAHEAPMWVAAARASDREADERRLTALGLTRAQLEHIIEAIGGALDGHRLSLVELGRAVVRQLPWSARRAGQAFGSSDWPQWRIGLGHAAARGLLCFGPNRGTQVTFVRPNQWLRTWREVDTDAALVAVLRRFLRAYGPATVAEFAQWAAIHPRRARNAVSAIATELEEIDVEGERRLELAGEAETPRPARSVRLLPHFDAYLRGFHPRRALTGGHAERAGGGTGTVPVLLVNGMVVGIWQRRATRQRVEVRVDPFIKLSARQLAELKSEAGRLAAFDALALDLTIGPVTARAHL